MKNTIIENCLKKYINNNYISGACAAVSHYNKEIKIFSGYSDIENKISVSEKSLFRLASMTKPVTAVAILICRDRQQLNLNDNISKFLPEFKNMQIGKLTDGKPETLSKANREITIIDLLTHSSGIGSGELGNYQYNKIMTQNPLFSLKEKVNKFSNMLLDFQPGTRQLYSPLTAFDILAEIVETVSGMPYEKFIKENIFDCLNMVDTTYSPDKEQNKRLVKIYTANKNKLDIFNLGNSTFEGFYSGYPSGSAGLIGSLNDYINFSQMLLNYGVFNGNRILSEESVRLMQKPYLNKNIEGVTDYFNWGLGVRVLEKHDKKLQQLPEGTFGWSGAYGTHFFIIPKIKLAAILMLNLSNCGGSGSIVSYDFEKAILDTIKEN